MFCFLLQRFCSNGNLFSFLVVEIFMFFVFAERYCKLPLRKMSFSLKSDIEKSELLTPSNDDHSSVKITPDAEVSVNVSKPPYRKTYFKSKYNTP